MGVDCATLWCLLLQHRFGKGSVYTGPKLADQFLENIFAANPSNPAIAIEHAFAAHATGSVVVAATSLNLHQYERLGLCTTELKNQPRPVFTRYWGGEDAD